MHHRYGREARKSLKLNPGDQPQKAHQPGDSIRSANTGTTKNADKVHLHDVELLARRPPLSFRSRARCTSFCPHQSQMLSLRRHKGFFSLSRHTILHLTSGDQLHTQRKNASILACTSTLLVHPCGKTRSRSCSSATHGVPQFGAFQKL